MKHLKLYEKYIHTPQDKKDDINLLHEFVQKFEDKFEYRLNLDTSKQIKFKSYIGYGSEKYYYGTIEIYNIKYYKSKRYINYSINISTDINPNGITSENDIDRTFTIDFDIKQDNGRNSIFPDFYAYDRDINTVIDKFDYYVSSILNIKHLTKDQIKQKQIEKAAKKYNI